MTLAALQAALQPIMERVLDLEKNRAQGAPPGTAGGAGQTGNTPEGTAAGDGGGPSGAAAPGGSPSSIPADPGTADMAVPGDRDFSSYLEAIIMTHVYCYEELDAVCLDPSNKGGPYRLLQCVK